MATDQKNNSENTGAEKFPVPDTGNASNPSPHADRLEPAHDAQLLNEKAEKYLREVASIEDLPDAQDEEDKDEKLSEP